MKTIEINGNQGNSIILIGESLQNLKTYVPVEKAVIITDTNVSAFYRKDFPPYEIIEIGTGEQIKTLDTVREIYGRLLHLEADRSSFIIGIGGGIVCDIAGFVASTFMRGIRFGFVSTTLLSQVDASVGGKNGVNFKGYKNIMGMINQPEIVICDMSLLKTLPEREVLCGLAEIVKHGAIADAGLFSYLEENHQEALNLEADLIERLVYDSVVIKTALVNKDEREDGERKKLNFGHTFGHAIEKVTGIQHGEAVSAGMVVAARLSEKRGNISPEDTNRLEALLRKLKLPTELSLNKVEILDALRKDKKRKGDFVDFVLLQGIGNAVLEEIPLRELEAVIMGQN
ncbi:MAG: 3-dehydroquinate synthase [Deltaproteobacteria bacterium]|nr:3-dehydroquinate synthase [Deltaproteobacteria bacterium]